MISISKKRKHFEEVHVDPRYEGLVEYSYERDGPAPYRRYDSSSSNGHEMKRHRQPEHGEVGRAPRRVRYADEVANSADDGNVSDTGADIGETETDPRIHDISHAFNDFNASLANLLALVEPGPRDCTKMLDSVIGKDRGSFVRAMKAMERDGSLSWLCNPRQPPSPGPSDVAAAAEAPGAAPKRNFSNSSNTSAKTGQTRESHSSSTRPDGVADDEGRNVRPRTASSGSNSSGASAHSTSWPPRLPKIHNKDVRRQVFTHKSIIAGGGASQIGAENIHNERLEFLGDSLLGAIVTKMIFKRFPTAREGPLSTLRSSCVENKTLNEFARMYEFDTKIITDKKERVPVLLQNPKTLADIFEAYIGGLLLDRPDGEAVVGDWLRDLFEPKFVDFEKAQRELGPVDRSAKNTLQGMIGGKNVRIDYRLMGGGGPDGPEVALIFTGWGLEEVELGRGWGSNKQDASLRAAMNALKGTQLAMVRRAKSRWYDEHSVEPSETGTTVRHPQK